MIRFGFRQSSYKFYYHYVGLMAIIPR